MFSHFLLFDFHKKLNENIKNCCVLSIRYFSMLFLGSFSSLNHKNKPCFTNRCTRMSAHHLRDLQCKRASRSMHSQVYVRCVFKTFCGVVFGDAFSSLLGGSKTVLEPNMAPTWVDFGAMLEQFWTIFGCSFALFI